MGLWPDADEAKSKADPPGEVNTVSVISHHNLVTPAHTHISKPARHRELGTHAHTHMNTHTHKEEKTRVLT